MVSPVFVFDSSRPEKQDLLEAHPEVADRLRSYAQAFEEELSQNSRPAAFVDSPKPPTMTEKASD